MALKVDYVVKETGRNLVRNPLLSLATVVVRRRVDRARRRVAARPPGRRQRHRAVAGRHRVHRLHEPRRHARSRSTPVRRALDEQPAGRRPTTTSTRTPPSPEFRRALRGGLARAGRRRSRPTPCRRRSRSSRSTPSPTSSTSLVRQFSQQAGVYARSSPPPRPSARSSASPTSCRAGMVDRRHRPHARRPRCSSASPSRRRSSPGAGRSR